MEKVAVELDRKEFTGATPNAADSSKYEAVDGDRRLRDTHITSCEHP